MARTLHIATLRGPSSAQMASLIENGEYYGISVSISDEPLQVLAEMMNGDVDFAMLPVAMAPALQKKGLDYKMAAVTIWGGLYLCGTTGNIPAGTFTLEALRGRTVHTLPRGMAPEILFRHILAGNGLVPDSDVLLDYSYPTHRELTEAAMQCADDRTEHFFVLPEPLLSQALAANPRLDILADLAGEWEKVEGHPLPVTALFSKTELVEEQPEKVKAIVDALRISSRKARTPRSGFRVVPFEEAESDVRHFFDSIFA